MNQVITLYNVRVVAGQSFQNKDKTQTYYPYEVVSLKGKRIFKSISSHPVEEKEYFMYQIEVRGSMTVLSTVSEDDF